MTSDYEIIENLYDRNLLKDDEQVVLAEGFEKAIIGITADTPKRVVYDFFECVHILINEARTKAGKKINFNESMDWLESYIEETKSESIKDIAPIFIKKI